MHFHFDNRFATSLPADPSLENRPRQVRGACYSRVSPTPVSAPYLIAHSAELCDQLGLSPNDVASSSFVQVFAGNELLPGMFPIAACYGGHQFGNWAGQLGDGRAISLGEVVDVTGQRQELQLKGAGPTPYSRTADGRAVLRSSLREFLCSEAMHHLGVPTTRALCLVGTGDRVERDILYDGHPRFEPGAIVCRVAPSFLRFGNFEIFASRGDEVTLRKLVEYTIREHFPHLLTATGAVDGDVCARFFEEVCARTAVLVTHWMRVGFVHGVLNTDNMSVLGLTIDYGPYGWVEDYDVDWTPNTTDASGRRYRFGYQPRVAGWNLARLAEALLPIVKDVSRLERTIEDYAAQIARHGRSMQRQKLGFSPEPGTEVLAPDTPDELFEALVELLQAAETDMTLFFRGLARVPVHPERVRVASDAELVEPLLPAYYQEPDRLLRGRLGMWLRRYAARLAAEGFDPERRIQSMNAVNPKYVLRNYMAQLAIDDAEKGDFALVRELLDVLRKPYDEQPGRERFATRRPEWARNRPGCSMLSCSS